MNTQQQYILICPNCGSDNTVISYSDPLEVMGCYECKCDYHNTTGQILVTPRQFWEQQRSECNEEINISRFYNSLA